MVASAADTFMASLGLPEVYRVGGSVRDELLGRRTKDHDYVVRGAGHREIASRLARAGCKPRSLKLRDGRTVGARAAVPGVGLVEVIMPRTELSTGPGHRDFEIVCDPAVTLEDDARRRDFTVNALYADVSSGEVLDPLGAGREDLGARVIRTTHPDSFRDDPLRTLRALRFASVLGFDLVESTYQQMCEHAQHVTALTLKGVSGTALSELCGLLMGSCPAASLRMMRDSGVFDVLLPEMSSMVGFEQRSVYHDLTVDEHTFAAVQAAADRGAALRVRLALLFHDAGKPWMAWSDDAGALHYYALSPAEARERGEPTAVYGHEWWGAWLAVRSLDRLKAPADLRDDVRRLVERHMLPLDRVKPLKVRRWRSELGDALLRDLIEHRRCDVLAKGVEHRGALLALDWLEAEQQRAIDGRVPCSPKGLAIGGDDLMALGLKGPALGDVQRRLLDEVMAQPKLNTPEWLSKRARSLL